MKNYDKIEAYLKKAGFCKIARKDVWIKGMAPNMRVVDMEKEPPWIGLSTGVQRQEAEECGVGQVLDIKNMVLSIYNSANTNDVERKNPDGDDGRSKAQKKSQAEINPVPQSSESSASGETLHQPAPIICDWDKKECKGENCIFYGKTEPILGKLCPLIKPNVAPTKVYACKDCKKDIDEAQAKRTFEDEGRALCAACRG